MTELNRIQLAAKEVLARRVAGNKSPRLDETIRPNSIDDALEIQSAMIEQRADAVAGWKCLLPPGDDKVVVAPIFADTIQRGDHCSLMADNDCARIEPEIVFVLAKDLPAQSARYTEAQIDEAVGSVHMGLELIQSRFADDSQPSFYEKLADCLSNQGQYIGPEIDKALAYAAAAFTVRVTQPDLMQEFSGKHPNHLPQNPLYWLFNYMCSRGVSFKAGQLFTTGSYCGVVDVAFDQSTTIRYEGIGAYEVEFKRI